MVSYHFYGYLNGLSTKDHEHVQHNIAQHGQQSHLLLIIFEPAMKPTDDQQSFICKHAQ